jgi:thiol-disulfide isomerase/thioredoxin
MNALRMAGLALAVALALPALAAGKAVPHLDERGQADYANYQAAAGHRAFAIAPGGTWAWHAELPSEQLALEAALQDCQRYTEQRCVPYAVDNKIVFDARSWPLSWGPYLTVQAAAKAATGMKRGQRFPDLVFQSPSGRQGKLSDLRGKVVVLHFWGSWCPPCQREMPELQALYSQFRNAKDVAFVVLPVREAIDVARGWAKQKKLSLPIAFGGEASVKAGEFSLADGGRLSDRQLAKAFPTTYVLDKHGIVVFSKIGPVARWSEYGPFLKDTAAKSGK